VYTTLENHAILESDKDIIRVDEKSAKDTDLNKMIKNINNKYGSDFFETINNSKGYGINILVDKIFVAANEFPLLRLTVIIGIKDLKNEIINKSGFLIYTDYWEKYFSKMSGEQIKEVFKIIFCFNKTFEILKTDDLAVEMVVATIIDNIKILIEFIEFNIENRIKDKIKENVTYMGVYNLN
jgi:hypothetical protein